jgi:hypothetical protein
LRFKVRPFLHISIYLTCSAAGMNHIQIRLSPYSYEPMLFIVRHIPTSLHHDLYKNVSKFLEVRKWCIEQRTLNSHRKIRGPLSILPACINVLAKTLLSLTTHSGNNNFRRNKRGWKRLKIWNKWSKAREPQRVDMLCTFLYNLLI